MKLLQLIRRRGPDRGDASSAEVAHVVKLPEVIFKKGRDSIRARENQPIVGIQLEQRIHEALALGWRIQLDGRHFEDLRAEIVQFTSQHPALLARPRNDHALPKQRTTLEPI